MSKAKLATFRIDENDWDAFQGWAKAKGTNASSELIGFVQACIGKGDRLSVPEQLDNDIDKLRAEMKAAIAPIIARLEKLEQPSNTGIPVTESEQAEQPLLDYLETNQAIAIDTPSESIPETTEKDLMGNNPETTIKPIAGDFSGGLSGKELATRFRCDAGGLSKASKKDNFADWSKELDPDNMAWRRDGDGRNTRYFPVES